MWQIHGVKECALIWGDLTGGWKQSKKLIVITNTKKSEEVIVPNSSRGIGKDGTKKMNVTNGKFKNRKPQKQEGYSGMVLAEQGEKSKAFACRKIIETKHIDTDFSKTGLLEQILDRHNMNKSYKRVVSNKGASGIDKMSVYELMPYLKENKDILLEKLRMGKYKPRPVLRVEIRKETKVDMPQGGNLSPLLSNVMLNELDKELERRRHRFVRQADDGMIFCRNKRSAERTLNNILPYIEGKLKLKVNRKKTKIAHIGKVKYLGYSFYNYHGKYRFRLHPKSLNKMKNDLKRLTSRSNGW